MHLRCRQYINAMKEFKVLIPDEHYSVLNFRQEEFPGVAVVNTALRNFEPKEVFGWHLSIMLQCEDLIENGMPSNAEVEIINDFGDFLDDKIKGTEKKNQMPYFSRGLHGMLLEN
jgi:hypothetical protein